MQIELAVNDRAFLVDIVVTDPGRPGTYFLAPEAPETEILGVLEVTDEPKAVQLEQLPTDIADKLEEEASKLAIDAYLDAEAERYLDNEVRDD